MKLNSDFFPNKFRGRTLHPNDVQQLENMERNGFRFEFVDVPPHLEDIDGDYDCGGAFVKIWNGWVVRLSFIDYNGYWGIELLEKIKPYVLKLSHLEQIDLPGFQEEEIPDWLWDRHLY